MDFVGAGDYSGPLHPDRRERIPAEQRRGSGPDSPGDPKSVPRPVRRPSDRPASPDPGRDGRAVTRAGIGVASSSPMELGSDQSGQGPKAGIVSRPFSLPRRDRRPVTPPAGAETGIERDDPGPSAGFDGRGSRHQRAGSSVRTSSSSIPSRRSETRRAKPGRTNLGAVRVVLVDPLAPGVAIADEHGHGLLPGIDGPVFAVAIGEGLARLVTSSRSRAGSPPRRLRRPSRPYGTRQLSRGVLRSITATSG